MASIADSKCIREALCPCYFAINGRAAKAPIRERTLDLDEKSENYGI